MKCNWQFNWFRLFALNSIKIAIRIFFIVIICCCYVRFFDIRENYIYVQHVCIRLNYVLRINQCVCARARGNSKRLLYRLYKYPRAYALTIEQHACCSTQTHTFIRCLHHARCVEASDHCTKSKINKQIILLFFPLVVDRYKAVSFSL